MDFQLLAALGLGLLIGAVASYLITKARLRYSQFEQQVAIESRLNAESALLKDQLTRLQAQHEAIEKDHSALYSQLQQLQQERLQAQQQLSTKQAELSSLKTELEQKALSHNKELQLLLDAKQQLSIEFESLANRIFEEKSQRFDVANQKNLDATIKPLREQLVDFKKKVEDVYDKESRDRVSLSAELGQLKELNQKMSLDALNLTKALKGDNKTQGNWGEVILERVLEDSGLRKGHEYDTQVNLSDDSGSRRAPDVIVRLPENKDIIIDSKVSLVDYERYCKLEDEGERQLALKAHVQSVRNHIQGLSQKNYQDLKSIRSLDFVFIFIPIEAAFMAAFEYDQAMYSEAYEKNIIVVGPTTLLATLRTVQSIWRYERQNKYAEEIARQAGAMHDKFVNFVEDINKIAYHLDKASESQRSALNKLSTGRGNLVGSTAKLEKLGAKVKKKMPDEVMLNQADEELDALELLDDDGQ
ncbi:DNA recombination protein RmuC [Dasania marina]|uniref:DNA recombination protein RmuC n=1 Tax=Dasania marina TaxID=471499 RepID=UPI0030DA5357|tara:strand:+ start:34267 stop:35685 length:1419 start_codon:yes stop_codon:yes gene_type:complete